MLSVLKRFAVLCRPGGDLLSQVLRHSTIGAEEFNGRVRDGIGFRLLAIATRPAKDSNFAKQAFGRFRSSLPDNPKGIAGSGRSNRIAGRH